MKQIFSEILCLHLVLAALSATAAPARSQVVQPTQGCGPFSAQECRLLEAAGETRVRTFHTYSKNDQQILLRSFRQTLEKLRFRNDADFRVRTYSGLEELQADLPHIFALWPKRPGAYERAVGNAIDTLERLHTEPLKAKYKAPSLEYVLALSESHFSVELDALYRGLLAHTLAREYDTRPGKNEAYLELKVLAYEHTTRVAQYSRPDAFFELAGRLRLIKERLAALRNADPDGGLLPKPIPELLNYVRPCAKVPGQHLQRPPLSREKAELWLTSYEACLEDELSWLLGKTEFSALTLQYTPKQVKSLLAFCREFAIQASMTPEELRRYLCPQLALPPEQAAALAEVVER